MNDPRMENTLGIKIGGAVDEPAATPLRMAVPLQRGERERLPDKRKGMTIKVHIGGAPALYLRTGEYEDGRIGEIFIAQSKTGTFNRGVLEGFAMCVSMGLQYGVPLSAFVHMYQYTNFEPNGMTDDPDVPDCSSVFDYIVRRLALDYPKQV